MTTIANLDHAISTLEPAVSALRTHVRRSYIVDGEVHPALVRRYELDMEEADEARDALTLLRQMREGAVEVELCISDPSLVADYIEQDARDGVLLYPLGWFPPEARAVHALLIIALEDE